jgi:hypothetical protein
MTRPLRNHPGTDARGPDQSPAPCTRCGAVGTHYLTCPGLRLPPGYRLSADPGLESGPERAPAGRRARA